MHDLLQTAVASHGGLKRWHEISAIKVAASITGAIWFVKSQGDYLKNIVMTADTMRERLVTEFPGQDEDSGARVTPVVAGDWNIGSVDRLYRKTAHDLAAMLTENRIRNRVFQELFLDLYNDYLHVALEAMRTGVAA
jgi:hypothetical protein